MEPMASRILFVRNDGLFEVGTIDQIDGQYVQTQRDTGFSADWTHVVAVGPHVLLVRNDGRFAVGHIDQETGHYAETDGAAGGFSADWTHVVAVGPRILYVASAGGLGAVGHINWIGQHVETQSGPIYSIDWDHVVAVA